MYVAAAKSLQSYQALCDPINSSLPGSPVPGILQARTLEWGLYVHIYINAYTYTGPMVTVFLCVVKATNIYSKHISSIQLCC